VRARLSSDGKLFTCLFTTLGHDLSDLIRDGSDASELTEAITEVWTRRSDRYSEERSSDAHSLPKVEMSYIGG
jgi:cyclic pyranopterin phosphate synthase